jgi:hypothetical protein
MRFEVNVQMADDGKVGNGEMGEHFFPVTS